MWLSSTCCPTCCGVCGGRTIMIWKCNLPPPKKKKKKKNKWNAQFNMEKRAQNYWGLAFTSQCPTAKVIFHKGASLMRVWRWTLTILLTVAKPSSPKTEDLEKMLNESKQHIMISIGGCCGIWSLCHSLFTPCVLPCSHIRQYCGGHHRWGSTGCFFTGPP